MDEACQYYEAVIAAEKIMGPLMPAEKLIILAKFGKDVTHDSLIDLLQGKRVLAIRGDANDKNV